MPQRFAIIDGGLSSQAPATGGVPSMLADRWRVVPRQARSVDGSEMAAWRSLIERQPVQDPFADPDYLLTAARHGARGSEIVFGLIFAESGSGPETLAGVVPLLLENPVWGGASIRLWHPPLAPRPVEPVLDAGCAAAGLEALIRHLSGRFPEAVLRLDRMASGGGLLRALRADQRLRATTYSTIRPIPATSFVEVRPRKPAPEIEQVTAASGMRDAVERFLLAEAQASRASLLDDPVDATITRVVTRLFAQRNSVCIELGRRDGEIVSGSIRLGRGADRPVWRSIGLHEPSTDATPLENIEIRLAEDCRCNTRVARLRLIGS